MNDIVQIILFIFIILISTALRSAFGFGNALIAMPLLVLLLDLRTATPLVGLIGLITAVVMLLKEWRQLQFREAVYLLLASMVGIPIGLYMFVSVPEVIVRGVLGLVLMGFGIYNLAGLDIPKIESGILALPFGFISGILGGAYNTNGPPIVIYGVMRGWSQEKFRATLQGYFLMTGLVVAASQGAAGLWTKQVGIFFLISVPVILVGVLAGGKIAATIPAEKFSRALNIFLILLGILMFI